MESLYKIYVSIT